MKMEQSMKSWLKASINSYEIMVEGEYQLMDLKEKNGYFCDCGSIRVKFVEIGVEGYGNAKATKIEEDDKDNKYEESKKMLRMKKRVKMKVNKIKIISE